MQGMGWHRQICDTRKELRWFHSSINFLIGFVYKTAKFPLKTFNLYSTVCGLVWPMDKVLKFYFRRAHRFLSTMFCCKMLLYIVNANKMLEMREASEWSYELVIHNIILQLLSQKLNTWCGRVRVCGHSQRLWAGRCLERSWVIRDGGGVRERTWIDG